MTSNSYIDTFMQEELDKMAPFETVEIPANDFNLHYIETVSEETTNACKELIKKDGKLRNIFYNIKHNKLSKKETNEHLSKISKDIKKIILNDNINNPEMIKLVNKRMDQILKNVIYSIIDI
jgi:hypothetical protein